MHVDGHVNADMEESTLEASNEAISHMRLLFEHSGRQRLAMPHSKMDGLEEHDSRFQDTLQQA